MMYFQRVIYAASIFSLMLSRLLFMLSKMFSKSVVLQAALPEAYAAISQRLFKFTANSMASLYMETPILLPTLTIRVSDDAMLPWERH